MPTVETKIKGYHVELCSWDDIDGPRTYVTVTYGRYSASLSYLESHGVLFDIDDRNKPVNPMVIDMITDWALAHGY